jgi:ubiquinone biosynthesis protein COQ4
MTKFDREMPSKSLTTKSTVLKIATQHLRRLQWIDLSEDMARPLMIALRSLNYTSHGIQSLPCLCILNQTSRQFSVLNRPPPNYPGHIPLTKVERIALAVGSAIGSLIDPRRGGESLRFLLQPKNLKLLDLIAALGEATAQPFFITRLHRTMLSHTTGRRILKQRPRITSTTMSMCHLRSLSSNTVGYAYAAWLDREGVSPDTRAPVQFIDDEEEAYVMQRYRECHDFYHALTGLPVVVEGEIALKAWEWANTGLPMTGLSMAAIVRLKKEERGRFWSVYGPWALKNGWRAGDAINIFWEEELETDVGELRERLGIEPPPDLREIRKADREKRKMEKQAREALKSTSV